MPQRKNATDVIFRAGLPPLIVGDEETIASIRAFRCESSTETAYAEIILPGGRIGTLNLPGPVGKDLCITRKCYLAALSIRDTMRLIHEYAADGSTRPLRHIQLDEIKAIAEEIVAEPYMLFYWIGTAPEQETSAEGDAPVLVGSLQDTRKSNEREGGYDLPEDQEGSEQQPPEN